MENVLGLVMDAKEKVNTLVKLETVLLVVDYTNKKAELHLNVAKRCIDEG